MEKTIKTLIVGILSTAMLVGCGNNAPANTEAVDPTPTVNAATADITVSEVPAATADTTVSEDPSKITENTESKNTENIYRVHVTDILGEPVPGVKVQFCSEDECTFGTTDDDGYVEFNQPQGQTYEIHLLKVPQGVSLTGREHISLSLSLTIHT